MRELTFTKRRYEHFQRGKLRGTGTESCSSDRIGKSQCEGQRNLLDVQGAVLALVARQYNPNLSV